MRKKLLLCIPFILGTAVSAQELPPPQQKPQELQQSTESQQYKQGNYHSILTVSGFAPLRDQRWNVGYMHQLNTRWWIGTEIAYGQKGMTPYNLGFEGDFKIFEVKPELYYSLNPNSRLKHFISAELSYLNHRSERTDAGYYDRSGQYYDFTSADFKRIRKGLSINYSILLHRESSWFGFMPKIGIGIAHRSITYRNVEGRDPSNEPLDVFPFFTQFDREQSGMRFMVNVDMKFIFKF
ncbi:hypothetical protein QE422_003171 [Chryseobacterium sp. SORGH_AS 447]|uniref:hypothetical protein n=1 Tax=Chryseobacterium sp. SORGH_AS_0447 TaxID=3041769 RepID=UPI0027868B3F|nr:hypothetical protein [Chryseobacterium sp. SORGH_AS_0447]MDQ1162803.1 hypothetical protein [Chryseobacterium sp. SORGH_AS_0447]